MPLAFFIRLKPLGNTAAVVRLLLCFFPGVHWNREVSIESLRIVSALLGQLFI